MALREYVLRGAGADVERAVAVLKRRGIDSVPRAAARDRQMLSVAAEHAAAAREILAVGFAPEQLVTAMEMLDYCPACGGRLSLGAFRCAECGAVVGDPHGR
ncbi:MAG: hypothetical protein IPI67_27385 [Myxococcales bacterium]|nr:hypothetical protein [Myxococcales bacterium]